MSIQSIQMEFIAGAFCGFLIIPFLVFVLGRLSVSVQSESAVLLMKFGRLDRVILEPGFHWLLSRALPWVRVIPVSMQLDFRHYREIHVNDRTGTTVLVDLWLEFRIADPEKALFRVDDWEESLRNLINHGAASVMSNFLFRDFLSRGRDVGEMIRAEIQADCERWGIRVESVELCKVNVVPEIAARMFDTVAAHLERIKDEVEERGRLRVAKLEAETNVKVAALVAEAKAEFPAAIRRAYGRLRENPAVFEAYQELYELSLIQPDRTTAFHGFDEREIRAVDAAMIVPSLPPSITAAISHKVT